MPTVGIDVSSLFPGCSSLAGLCVPLGLAMMPTHFSQGGGSNCKAKSARSQTRKKNFSKGGRNTRRKLLGAKNI